MAVTLYTIKNNFFKLQALAEEGILDPDELEESLQELELDAEDVCENMAKMIRQFEADNAALDVEIKRLQECKKRNTGNIDSFKKGLMKYMKFSGKKKVKTSLFSFNVQGTAASVVFDDESMIPEDFMVPQPSTPDKKKIALFLKGLEEGKVVPWAHLQKGETLVIK